MKRYDHKVIEKKWQKEWAKKGLYKTPDTANGKKNFYLLTEFPYPSGNLHVGHWYAFSVPDILARAMRMQGRNVLYPIGFDAFGLPAENAAIKRKLNPRKWTEKNIAHMKAQIRSMGAVFDWSREVQTIDPAYYKWTQWQFLQFFKRGLAYQKETPVNWCSSCKTVLANEQVVEGKCERCGAEVAHKEMLQWNLKITDYAERLLKDLDQLDWPEPIKEAQRAWIGKSEGAAIDFPLHLGTEKKKYTYVILHGFQGSPKAPRFRHWKAELEKDGHRVVIPRLPNTHRPSEEEQIAAALAAAGYDENTVLFGHSLGAPVAMKVVEKLKKPIARLVLAGGFVDRNFKDKPRNFDKRFVWQFDGAKIRKNAKTIQVLHDKNDYAISEEQLSRLEKTLAVNAERIEGEAPHFTGKKELPVLRWLRPTISVFTTRADTLFGATYLVLAPEHPWVTSALAHKGLLKNEKEIARYVALSAKKTERERQEGREKTGVELEGVKAINPATGEKISVWIADYVLSHYGTGAIMAVPAHDERDNEFAKKFGLPIKEVIEPLFVVKEGIDALKQDLPLEEREAVNCVVRDSKSDKYLVLKWKKIPWTTFVTGGTEGESPVVAGLREIREESGYTNVRFVRELGGTVHARFFHPNKKVNRWAQVKGLYFELVDRSREALSREEAAIHDVHWLTAEEVEQRLNVPDMRAIWHRHTWNRYRGGKQAYTKEGILADSGKFSGMESVEAHKAITAEFGCPKKTCKIRDWVVSRQRYWGVPIPIVHCKECGPQAVPYMELPVKLPEVKDYLPDGRGKSPLAKAKKWVNTKCPKCKGHAERETDTLDTFVDSSWYFLRYIDPKNKRELVARSKLKNWMPVDLYSGGAEHTTMHLLYSRFWHKALYDLKLVADKEPYARRMNRSLILGPDGQKMSKSRGNVVDPDEVVERLGADTVRMYLAFIGPYSEVSNYPWNPDGVVGIRRFLERAWRAQDAYVVAKTTPELEKLLHKTIKKVGEDISELKFNTAISQLMIFLNHVEQARAVGKSQWKSFLRLLASFAPHIVEELWHALGNKKSIHLEKWPKHDANKLKEETLMIAVQINGKIRGEAEVPSEADNAALESAAREAVASRLEGKTIARTIVVSGRLVNFVTADY